MKFICYIGILLCLTGLLSSCVEDNAFDEDEIQNNVPKIKAITDKYEVGLFDMSLLELSSEKFPKNSAMNSFMYSELLDSVVWVIPGEFVQKSTQSNFLAKKGQVFIQPATYSFYIAGFKNGKKVDQDSLEIQVVNKHDFLGVNWTAVKDSSYITYDNNILDFSLNLKTYQTENGPLATLVYQFSSEPIQENRGNRAERSKLFLKEYISSLYGLAKAEAKNTNAIDEALIKRFKANFNYKLSTGVQPLAVWETQKSTIALLEHRNPDNSDDHYYWIVAEPRK
ncbi:hypothetical protein ACFRAE_01565 [Sphingobacterium sp. HJSM2_6]|uniref:hypothetical protein n=1 Tax=Sphingobacterium sp. HJSM2_6 TaxID=3366264 RepID=UPI003BCE346D